MAHAEFNYLHSYFGFDNRGFGQVGGPGAQSNEYFFYDFDRYCGISCRRDYRPFDFRLSIADKAVLLERGQITLRGTGQELLKNPEVIERYLGVGNSVGTNSEKRIEMSLRIRTALGDETGKLFSKNSVAN